MSQLGGANIGGGLSFGGYSGSYQGAYENALSANQRNYSNIISGFQQLMSSQQAAQKGVVAGYTGLQNQVMGTIQGSQQDALNQVNALFTNQSGQASQQMIDAGLGNSTIQQSVQAGIKGMQGRGITNVQNTYANTLANYQSQLGLAGLNYQGQAIQQNSQLGAQQLGFMAGINIPYPNMADYYNPFNVPGGNTPNGPMGPGPKVGTGQPHQTGLPGGGDVFGGGGGGTQFGYDPNSPPTSGVGSPSGGGSVTPEQAASFNFYGGPMANPNQPGGYGWNPATSPFAGIGNLGDQTYAGAYTGSDFSGSSGYSASGDSGGGDYGGQ